MDTTSSEYRVLLVEGEESSGNLFFLRSVLLVVVLCVVFGVLESGEDLGVVLVMGRAETCFRALMAEGDLGIEGGRSTDGAGIGLMVEEDPPSDPDGPWSSLLFLRSR